MSGNSPDSLSNEPSSDGPERRDAPRKRSKVSRACDACRRKKVRCDAEFSSSLSKVTKICTNCLKVGDECLFSRVPLKRGPSKGYLKDLSDRLENSADAADYSDSSLSRPRSKSIDVAGYSAYVQNGSTIVSQAPLSPMSTSHMKPLLHRLKFSSSSGTKSPIILPPLIGNQPPAINSHIAYPNPQNIPVMPPHGIESPDARLVGPLWKVPYEMPTSNGPGSNSSSPGAFNRADFDSRRSSVDSVSSVSTVGSRSRLASFNTMGASMTDGNTTSPDPEDLGKTNASSPRNSVSSLSSLNGRMAKNLQLNGDSPPGNAFEQNTSRLHTPQSTYSNNTPVSINGNPSSSTDQKHMPMSTVCPIPLNSLDHNLSVYYSQFHSSFPVLPNDRTLLYQAVSELSSASSICLEVTQLFNAALNNLVNCQFITLEASKHLLLRALSAYPLQIFIPALSEKVSMIYSASLILINYVNTLRGECFPLGISSTLGIFNDMDILKNLKHAKKMDSSSHVNELQSYLPHLYSCLEILDSCSSLAFGKQHLTSTFLLTDSEVLIDAHNKTYAETWFHKNVSIAKSLRALVEYKDGNMLLESRKRSSKSSLILAQDGDSEGGSFSRLFAVLLKDTYSVHDFLLEVSEFLRTKMDLPDYDDEFVEHVHDYHLKTSRLVKKLSQSILNYANYVSTSFFQARSPSATNLSEFNNPFFNVSYSRALNSIKLSKKLIDLLTKHVKDNELFTRSLKINNNLSIAFNLLMGNLNNNFNVVTNTKSFLNDQTKSNLTSPNPVGVYGLGICCMNTLSKSVFDLNFNETSPSPNIAGSKNTDMNAWRSEILGITDKYVNEELQEGWLMP